MVPENLLKSHLLDQQIQQQRSFVISANVLHSHIRIIQKTSLEHPEIIYAEI